MFPSSKRKHTPYNPKDPPPKKAPSKPGPHVYCLVTYKKTGDVGTIPEKWNFLSKTGKQCCYCPPYEGNAELKAAIHEAETPDPATWDIYDITIHYTGSFQRCEQLEDTLINRGSDAVAEMISNTVTDNSILPNDHDDLSGNSQLELSQKNQQETSEEEKKKKKKKKKKRKEEREDKQKEKKKKRKSSEDSIEEMEAMESDSSNNDHPENHINAAVTIHVTEQPDQRQVSHPGAPNARRNNSSGNANVAAPPQGNQTPRSSCNNCTACRCTMCRDEVESDRKYRMKVLRVLHHIQGQMEVLTETRSNHPGPLQIEGVRIPMKKLKDLTNMEAAISPEIIAQLKSHLAIHVDKTPYHTARNMMRSLFCIKLMRQLNWEGQGRMAGKQGLKKIAPRFTTALLEGAKEAVGTQWTQTCLRDKMMKVLVKSKLMMDNEENAIDTDRSENEEDDINFPPLRVINETDALRDEMQTNDDRNNH